jgi:hypothetical protein
MIVNVRGACGSGKSTVVRAVLRPDREWGVIGQRGRKQPVGYVSVAPSRLFVAGHYEIHMGGIDTFETIQEAYKWIEAFAAKGFHVLFEGKCQYRDLHLLLRLRRWGLTVLHLDVTAREAVLGVRGRPSATGIRTENIERSHRKAERDCRELETTARDVRVLRLSRREAALCAREILQ